MWWRVTRLTGSNDLPSVRGRSVAQYSEPVGYVEAGSRQEAHEAAVDEYGEEDLQVRMIHGLPDDDEDNGDAYEAISRRRRFDDDEDE